MKCGTEVSCYIKTKDLKQRKMQKREAEAYRDTKIKEYEIDGAEYDINEFAIEIGCVFEW
jgi:hypothetical protein